MSILCSLPIPKIEFPEGTIVTEKDNNEKLVCLNRIFVCESKYHRWKNPDNEIVEIPDSSDLIFVRESVADMLIDAQELLSSYDSGYKLKIYDGYRPIAVQQFLWDYYYNKNLEEMKNISSENIFLQTSQYISYPSYVPEKPSLHNTGGAVDLTIINNRGEELCMGCEFDEFTEIAKTDYYEKKQRKFHHIPKSKQKIII